MFPTQLQAFASRHFEGKKLENFTTQEFYQLRTLLFMIPPVDADEKAGIAKAIAAINQHILIVEREQKEYGAPS